MIHRFPRLPPLAVAVVLVAGASTSAQELLRTWSLGARRANALHVIPDTDGDGLPEFLIGDFSFGFAPPQHALGKAFIVLSADGSVPFERRGTVPFQNLGAGVGSVGDVDGDGVEDFGISSMIFTTAIFPQLQVFSGRDRKLLFERTHPGVSMASLGDQDGDGRDEFVLGDPVHGIVTLLRGGTFQVLHEWHRTRGPLGASVAVLADLDRDGWPEVAAGAPGGSVPVGNWPGKVEVFSAGDHARIFEVEGEGVTEQFGRNLAVPGDLNGDGFDDLVVAGPECCSDISEFDGPGRLYFFDVRNGVKIEVVDMRFPETFYGYHVDEAGDVNGDGVGDVLASFDRSGASLMEVLDGATRRRIGQLPGSIGFVGGRDWNDDTIPDMVVMHPPSTARELRLYSGAPLGVRILGKACERGSPEPRIGCTGSARLGATLPVHLSAVAPGRPALLLLGEPQKLAAPGACRPRLSVQTTLATTTTAVSPGKGSATIPLPIPNDPTLQGRTLHVQWLLPGAPGQPQQTTRVLAAEILAP